MFQTGSAYFFCHGKKVYGGRRRRAGGTLGRSQGRGGIDARRTRGDVELMKRGALFIGRMRPRVRAMPREYILPYQQLFLR